MNSQLLIASLGWTLVHFLWQGLVIAALLAAGLRLLRGAASSHCYLAGCVALALMLAAPAITFQHVAAQYAASAPADIKLAETSIGLPAVPANSSVKKLKFVTRPDVPSRNFSERIENIFPWLVLSWLLGVFALSCRLLGGWLQIERLKRSAASALDQIWHDKLAELAQRLGIRKSVRLLQSALVEVPTVIGWLRPVILLPASCLVGLTPAQLESILAHELAHIRRHDYLVNLLQSVVETVLFYHPAVWWVSRRVREERENCCDDLAVEVCGDRVGYARALATLEELRLAPAPFALGAAGSPLLPRIRRLAGRTPSNLSRPVWPLAGIVMLLLLAALTIGLRENRAGAEENSNPTPNSSTSNAVPKNRSSVSNAPVQSLTNNPTPAKKILSGKGMGRQKTLSKLAHIEIDSLQFDHAPLTEVINKLAKIAKTNDPDHIGINFYIDKGPPRNAATGLPLIANQTDIEGIRITINPALKHLKLADALEAITKSADHPITYSIFDNYAVVFRLKDPNEVILETRKFHVDPTALKQALRGFSQGPAENVLGDGNQIVPSSSPTTPGLGFSSSSTSAGKPWVDDTNESAVLAMQFRQFLSAAGVYMGTNNPANVGNAFIYNARKGILLIRATAKDLDKVDQALQRVLYAPHTQEVTNSVPTNATPKATEPKTNSSPQVNLKVKLIEFDASPSSRADFESILPILKNLDYTAPAPKLITSTTVSTNGSFTKTRSILVSNPFVSQVSGLLSEEQFKKVINELERSDGVDELNMPEVTTESGRQAQVQAVDIQDIATGLATSRDSHGKAKYEYQFESLQFGPVVDLVPSVSAADRTDHVKVVATVTEFLGYGDPSHLTKEPPKNSILVGKQTQPIFRLRQMETNAVVPDGQTIVLAGLEAERMGTMTNSVLGGLFHTTSTIKIRKILLVFITSTLINPDGTRLPEMHAPVEMGNGKKTK